MTEALYTVKGLAAATGYAVSVIYHLVESGQLAHHRLTPRGRIRIARADWNRCLERLRKPAKAEASSTIARGSVLHLAGSERYIS